MVGAELVAVVSTVAVLLEVLPRPAVGRNRKSAGERLDGCHCIQQCRPLRRCQRDRAVRSALRPGKPGNSQDGRAAVFERQRIGVGAFVHGHIDGNGNRGMVRRHRVDTVHHSTAQRLDRGTAGSAVDVVVLPPCSDFHRIAGVR